MDKSLFQTVHEKLKAYENLPYHIKQNNPAVYVIRDGCGVFYLQQPPMKKYLTLTTDKENFFPIAYVMHLKNEPYRGKCNSMEELDVVLKQYGS